MSENVQAMTNQIRKLRKKDSNHSKQSKQNPKNMLKKISRPNINMYYLTTLDHKPTKY